MSADIKLVLMLLSILQTASLQGQDNACHEKVKQYISEALSYNSETERYKMEKDWAKRDKEMLNCFNVLTRKDIRELMGTPNFIHPFSGDFYYCLSIGPCEFTASRTDSTKMFEAKNLWFLVVKFTPEDKVRYVSHTGGAVSTLCAPTPRNADE